MINFPSLGINLLLVASLISSSFFGQIVQRGLNVNNLQAENPISNSIVQSQSQIKVSQKNETLFEQLNDILLNYSAAGKPPTKTPGSSTPTQTFTPSQTFTPTNPPANDLIFFDDFERGNLSTWSSAVTGGGDLYVSTTAAIIGTYGLQALINDLTLNHLVQGSSPWSVTKTTAIN